MLTHATPITLSKAILMALLSYLLIASAGLSSGASGSHMTKVRHMPETAEAQVRPTPVSLSPSLDIEGGSSVQHDRLELAVSRFRDAGLALPDLVVVFSSTDDACQGHYGLYEDHGSDPRITFCSDAEFVYEHELAHAWEAHSATDSQREALMDVLGLATWADPDVGWGDRGVEGAAFTIQQTVGGLALPVIQTDAFQRQAAAYEALTGMPDPRLGGAKQ